MTDTTQFNGLLLAVKELNENIQELKSNNIKLQEQNNKLKEQIKILNWRLHEQD